MNQLDINAEVNRIVAEVLASECKTAQLGILYVRNWRRGVIASFPMCGLDELAEIKRQVRAILVAEGIRVR